MNQPLYKHYKGGYYRVITFNLIAFSNIHIQIDNTPFCKATVEYDLSEYYVYNIPDGSYFIQTDSPVLVCKRLVLYCPVGSKVKYWIRTYKNFFQPVDKTIKRFLPVMR